MRRRTLLAAAIAAPAAAPRLGWGQAATRARTLRFMPQAALAALDPVFNPTTIVTTHGYCVFDTLYGADRQLRPRPQMAEGHQVSADGLTWTIRLREGLAFHDGEPVRSVDCVASLKRWMVRARRCSTRWPSRPRARPSSCPRAPPRHRPTAPSRT